MKIELNKLKPHPFNKIFGNLPRNEFEALKTDIMNRGMQTTIDVTEDFTIVCGHQRIRALKELGEKEVNIKVLKNWTDNQIKEHLIKDNVLRRQLNPQQIVDAGKELETIYHKRFGSKDYSPQEAKGGDQMITRLEEKGKTRDLVAKDFGISGGTYERYKQASEVINKTGDKELQNKWRQGKVKPGTIIREFKVKEQKKQIEKRVIEQPKGNFDVIVIDPPWSYGIKHDDDGQRGTTDYPTMSLEEIKNIKIPSNDDCVLWLWTTNSFLLDMNYILQEWGFEPKTILTWDKQHIGVGHWLRNVTEHCILAIKGKPYFNNKKWSTLISEKRTTHSTKPEIFYQMVDEICAGRKLDYFARKKRDGWEVYGDEIQ